MNGGEFVKRRMASRRTGFKKLHPLHFFFLRGENSSLGWPLTHPSALRPRHQQSAAHGPHGADKLCLTEAKKH